MSERIKLERDLISTKQMLEQTNEVARVGGWEVNLKNMTIFWSDSTKNTWRSARFCAYLRDGSWFL
jgi:hypothetical protein